MVSLVREGPLSWTELAVERRRSRVWKRTRCFRSATVAERSARFARLRGLDHEEEEAQEGQVGHREH